MNFTAPPEGEWPVAGGGGGVRVTCNQAR